MEGMRKAVSPLAHRLWDDVDDLYRVADVIPWLGATRLEFPLPLMLSLAVAFVVAIVTFVVVFVIALAVVLV
jgi:hypothetical protein